LSINALDGVASTGWLAAVTGQIRASTPHARFLAICAQPFVGYNFLIAGPSNYYRLSVGWALDMRLQ